MTNDQHALVDACEQLGELGARLATEALRSLQPAVGDATRERLHTMQDVVNLLNEQLAVARLLVKRGATLPTLTTDETQP